MSKLSYQNWYETKKEKESNVLYEKLLRLTTDKRLDEAEVSQTDQSKVEKASKWLSNTIGVDTNTQKGMVFLDNAKSFYREVANKQNSSHSFNSLVNSYIEYVRSSGVGSTLKGAFKNLFSENLKKSKRSILNEAGFKEMFVQSLFNLGWRGALLYFGIDTAKEWADANPEVKDNLSKGGISGSRAIKNTFTGLERLSNIGSEGATVVDEKAIRAIHCNKNTPYYRPGMPLQAGQWVRGLLPGYDKQHVIEVSRVNPQNPAQWGSDRKVLCDVIK